MKAIQEELGDKDEKDEEIQEFRSRVEKAGMPEDVLEEVKKQIDRLARMHPDSAETAIVRTYVEWMVEMWSSSCYYDGHHTCITRSMLFISTVAPSMSGSAGT